MTNGPERKRRKVVRITPARRLQHVADRLRMLCAAGEVSTSIGAAFRRTRLGNLDLEHVIETCRVLSERSADGTVFDGKCSLCVIEGDSLDGRRVRLMVEVQGNEAVITGVDFPKKE